MKNIIIVLGHKLNNNKMSNILKERLKKTLKEYNKTKFNIIVSGGKIDNNTVTEASVMKKWLVKNGVPKNKIISEPRSKDTEQNVKYCNNIIKKLNIKYCTIISSKYHIKKIKFFAKNKIQIQIKYK